MLADRRHAAANRLNAAEQAAGIKMLRPQRPSAPIDALEPRHQFEILPNGAQQDLIEVRVRVDKPGHENTTSGVDALLFVHAFCGSASANLRNYAVHYPDVTGDGLSLLGHRQDKRLGNY